MLGKTVPGPRASRAGSPVGKAARSCDSGAQPRLATPISRVVRLTPPRTRMARVIDFGSCGSRGRAVASHVSPEDSSAAARCLLLFGLALRNQCLHGGQPAGGEEPNGPSEDEVDTGARKGASSRP